MQINADMKRIVHNRKKDKGVYYLEMFNSQACWRTSGQVDRELKRLNSKSAKLDGLKENIRMRVLGLGWKDLHTAWSKNGKEYTVNELSNHLKKIISHQRTREIPNKPPVELPERKQLPTFGKKRPHCHALRNNTQARVKSLRRLVKIYG